MIEITARPPIVGVRAQPNPVTGAPELAIVGADPTTGLSVEIVVDVAAAAELAVALAGSKIDVAPASALTDLHRNGHSQ